MNISELRSKPHISVSGINSYVECGLQYRFRRIDRLSPESISDNLVFGSAIHKSLADFNQEKMTGNKLELKQLQDIFEIYWRDDAEDNKFISYSGGKDFNRLLIEGKNLLDTFYRDLPQRGFTILSIEEPFEFKIDGIDVPMIGVMDLVEEDDVDGAIVITEYKTASKAFSIDQIERLFQLTIYHMAAKRNGFGDREIVLKIDSLIKTQKPRFESIYTTRTDADERRATKKILEVWHGIQNNVFIPNDTSWKFSRCEYRGYCDSWAN
jgi:putative RecB family exonuclease